MATILDKPRATFKRMDEGTAEDWKRIGEINAPHSKALPARVIAHLLELDEDEGGFAVSRLEHSLQTATLALNAGKDEEYIVCALLHDIGDTLGSYNHADIAAAILKPFVSEQNHWIVEHHGIFQGYYFFHHMGLDRNMRDQFKDHPHYEACAEFCRLDQAAFNPDFKSEPLETFVPMVERVLARPKQSIYKKTG